MRRTKRWITGAGLTVGLAVLAAPAPARAYVYWAGEQLDPASGVGVGIGRADLDGQHVDPSFVPAPGGRFTQTRGVASDGAHVYFGFERYAPDGQFVAPMVGRVNIDGTGLLAPFSQTTGQAVTGIGVSPTHVYWTNQSQDTGSVGRTPIIGGQQFQAITSTFGEVNPKPCGVAADDTYMYFANQATSSIGRAELANLGTANQVVDGDWLKLTNGVEPCGVAVDAGSIYYGVWQDRNNPSAPAGRTVYRADKATGTNRRVLSNDGDEVSGVAVAGDHVYFSNHGRYLSGAASVKRVAKDGSGGTLTIVGGLTAVWGVAADLGGTTPPPADPPSAAPSTTAFVDSLSVGCTGCSGGSSAPEPRPADLPRPDFSRVWVTKKTFVAAAWNTALGGYISISTTASRARAARAKGQLATRSIAARPALPTSGPGGTSINYVLTRDATVKLAINRVTKGRRVGKACRRPTTKTRKKASCDRLTSVVTLTRISRAGTNAMPFSGRINDRALKPGRYRVVLTPNSGEVGAAARSIDLTVKAKG